MKVRQRTVLSVALAIVVPLLPAGAQSTISTNNRWVWSSGAGWINCRTDSTNGVAVGEFVLSGYWYSPSAGWIHLGDGTPTNGCQYVNDSPIDYGVNHDSKGHLSGYAWSESVGWINFSWTNNPDSTKAPKLNLLNGYFTGYAWGGSLGWISLSNMSAKLQTTSIEAGADGDNDGIPDAWEIHETGTTNLLAGSANSDGDPMTDAEEYGAGTSPMDRNDMLQLQGLAFDGSNVTVQWASKLSRLYRIEINTNLANPAGWVDCGTGLLSADSDTASEQTLSVVSTQGFYRIRAVTPSN